MEKYQHLFDQSQLQGDLKRRSLRSGAITLTSQAAQLVIQLGSTMILARILSPSDYGINAMAVSVTGFASVFSGLGLSAATIQRADINHGQVSTLFWINAAVGFLLTCLFALSAPAVASFYNTPAMLGVMLTLSMVFSITGLSVQHSALLKRQLRFLTLAKIQVTASVAGISVAIVAGTQGFGYWALVFNSLTSTLVSTLGCWLALRWIPGLPRRNVGVGAMIKFGADLVAFDAINYLSRNLDNILIGRYLGAGPLGLYSKAYQLLMLPVTNLRGPVNSVAMPVLSRLQNEPEKYRDYYLKCVELLAFVSMPLVMIMYTHTEPLILILLGSQWLGVAVIFKILAVAAFIQPVTSTPGMVMITTGQSRLYLKMGAASSSVVCASFVIGLAWGVEGVATAYVVAVYSLVLPRLYFAFRKTAIRVRSFLFAVYRPALACLVATILTAEVADAIGLENALVNLAVGSLASVLTYLGVFVMLPKGSDSLKEYYSYGLMIMSRKG